MSVPSLPVMAKLLSYANSPKAVQITSGISYKKKSANIWLEWLAFFFFTKNKLKQKTIFHFKSVCFSN